MELRDRLLRALQDAGIPQDRPRPASRAAYQQSLGSVSPPEPTIEDFLPGFWQDTPNGRIFVVERRYELDYRHGAYQLGSTLAVPSELLGQIGRHAALSGVDHRRLLYLDTETTGLAGGTGTMAFLVGIGHFLDGGFRLRQYFLDSLDREAALLSALSDYIEPFEAVVTYNGKVFDVPLLETRFILSRLRRDIRALPHLDLLFVARRLYRDRFSSCRLGEIERQVLGLTRPDDVPSFEVPGLYFRYVRSRRFRALVPVFKHNALDILSLVTLTAHLGQLFGGAQELSPQDSLALARISEADGRRWEAIERYTVALDAGLPPVPRDEAERRLSLLYKRSRRWDAATEIWYRIAFRSENRSIFPLVELAGYCEREARDLPAAIMHTEHALSLLRHHHLRFGAQRALEQETLLERRLARLQTRTDRASRTRPARRRPRQIGDAAIVQAHGTVANAATRV